MCMSVGERLYGIQRQGRTMPRRTRNKLPPGGKWDFFLSHTQKDGEGKMVATTIYYEMAQRRRPPP
eukprot:SAG22_NODE_69_length_22779_cov_71.088139_8_plen_66_part_00